MNRTRTPDAVQLVVEALEPLEREERERAMRWSGELLGLQAADPGANTLELVLQVMRESIKEDNETKRYFLGRLAMLSEVSSVLAAYLAELADASQRLRDAARTERRTTAVPTRSLEVVRDGEQWSFNPADAVPAVRVDEDGDAELSSEALSALITAVEVERESVRNDRQLATEQFESANQALARLYEALSALMKAIADLRLAVLRNMK